MPTPFHAAALGADVAASTIALVVGARP
jgi:hypothetical protein